MTAVLHPTDNLFDFFHDRVTLAARDERASFHDDTVLYLVQLLTERARSDRAQPDIDTLAELHGHAAHARPGAAARSWRELGDRALYLLGFFRESLERHRRTVGPAYYASMGSAAYGRCDDVLKRWFSDAFGPVFHELARQFDAATRVLSLVRPQDDPSHLALNDAYQQWLDASGERPSDGLLLPPSTLFGDDSAG